MRVLRFYYVTIVFPLRSLFHSAYRHKDIGSIIAALSWLHAWRRINDGSATDTDRFGPHL